MLRNPRSTRSISHSKLSSTSADHWKPDADCSVAKPEKALRTARRAWSMSAGAMSYPCSTAVNATSSRAPETAIGSSGPVGSTPMVAAYRPGWASTKSRNACAAAASASRPARPCVAAPTASAASASARAAIRRARSS